MEYKTSGLQESKFGSFLEKPISVNHGNRNQQSVNNGS